MKQLKTYRIAYDMDNLIRLTLETEKGTIEDYYLTVEQFDMFEIGIKRFMDNIINQLDKDFPCNKCKHYFEERDDKNV